MKACAEYRDLILAAEPGELRGEGETALAVHVRRCSSCARAAALVLEETARLHEYLGEVPDFDVDALLARTGQLAPEHERGAPKAPPRVQHRFPGRRLWVPLAAAAALAGLLLVRGFGIRAPATFVASSSPPPAPAPVVEPVAGQDAAIMQTDDPEITVVWLFSTG